MSTTSVVSVIYLPTRSDIEKRLAEAHQNLKRWKEMLEESLKATLVGCQYCGDHLPVTNLIYIQSHWYTSPYSCNGGDYWNIGEGGFKCTLCSQHNRLYQRPEVMELKRYFKSVEDRYDR